MSRSYRKPYASIVGGNRSIKPDRDRASRGARRKQTGYAKLHWMDEDFLLPHRYECAWNNCYSWSIDGKKRFCHIDLSLSARFSLAEVPPDLERYEWLKSYYEKLTRK
jgi:hypothetical protein